MKRLPAHPRKRGTTFALMVLAMVALMLAGCETSPPRTRYGPGYQSGPPPSGYYRGGGCYQGCGYVRDIREVELGNGSHATIGTVIGALVGGALGNQVGKGNGRKAATVAGAVAGGFAGHAIGKRSDNENRGWQVVVQLNNGQYATVTQRQPPPVQVGDYVVIRGDHVFHY
jgi:outer membrane lipoprotein SlyB